MDKKQMFNEITKWSQPQPLQPDEFIWTEYQDHLEKTTGRRFARKTICDRLNRLVDEGALQKRKVLVNSSIWAAFRPAEKVIGGKD